MMIESDVTGTRQQLDFHRLVRRHLPRLPVDPVRESEIVDELAQILRDAGEDEGIDPADDAAVAAWIRSQVPRWQELGTLIRHHEEGILTGKTTADPTGDPTRDEGERSRSRIRFSFHGLVNDLRYGLRMIRKSPGLAAVVVVTLALGIGLNSAVFSVVNSILLRPLPVEGEEQLVRVFSQEPNGFMSHEPMSYPDYLDLADQARSLENVAGFAMTFAAIEDRDGEAGLTLAEMVTGNYFGALGVRAALGRMLVEGDDRREDPQSVAVLSFGSWQSRFDRDPEIVGREIVVNGRPLVIVGVARRGFGGLMRGVEPALWMPIHTADLLGSGPSTNSGSTQPDVERIDDRGRRWMWVFGRRTAGASVEDTKAEAATIAARLEASYPDTNEDRDMAVLPLRQVKIMPGIDASLMGGSLVLMAVVTLVLLIAGFNLANLLLARAMSRRREMATRLSLGASRWRVVRQLLSESLMLATLGGLAGLGVAALSNEMLSRFRVPMAVPIGVEIGLDARVVLFTLGLAVLAAVVFGLAPALEAARTDLASTLRDESSGGGGHRWRIRLQRALVVAQVTFSLLLLIFAGLSLRSLLNANNIDIGIETESSIAATLAPDLQGYDEDSVGELYRRIEEELQALPGVVAVSQPSHLPLTLWMNVWDVVPEADRSLPEEEWFDVDTAAVDASYFETLGIPIVRGRTFELVENLERRRVAIINQSMASRLWPDQDPIGQLLVSSPTSDPYQVVGVARDGKYRTLGESSRSFLYTAIHPGWTTRTVVARFDRAERASPAAVRLALQRVDQHLAISNLASLEEVLSPSLLIPRAGALVFGLFGLLGVLLAAIGLYGVLAYMVGQRSHEIGIRVAVGARATDIVGMVARDGLILTGIGAILGLGLAFASTRLLSSMLYGIAPHDVVTFAAVVSFLVVVALIASYLPARRATKIDPIRALRFE